MFQRGWNHQPEMEHRHCLAFFDDKPWQTRSTRTDARKLWRTWCWNVLKEPGVMVLGQHVSQELMDIRTCHGQSWTIMDNHGHPGPVWGCSPKHLSNHFLELHGPFATGWYFSGKCYNWEYLSGWWFGTFLIFPYIGNSHPNWLMRTPPALCEQLTNIFQRGSNHQPAMVGHDQYWIPSGFIKHSWKVDHKSQWFSQIETSIYPEDFPAMFDETRG